MLAGRVVPLLGSPFVSEMTLYKPGLFHASPVGFGLEEFNEFIQKCRGGWEEDTENMERTQDPN